MKDVIIYYSNSGTTKALAEKIENEFGGELCALEPKESYGAYFAAVKRSSYERKNNIVPEYEAPAINLSDANVVFVGYPIWYSEPPKLVLDYLSKHDLSGKTVIPFSTSGGTGIKATLKSLEAAVGGAEIKLPYNHSIFFKTDFRKWAKKVRELAV